MITDDDLDRRLTDAGERWRTAHGRPADVEARPGRNHRWLAVAAAAVVALAVGLPIGLTRGDGGQRAAGGQRITGVTWQLVSADGHRNTDRTVTLRIEHGQVVFDDGVNSGGGPVTVSGSELYFGAIAVSLVGSGTYDPVSAAIDETLQGTARWTVTGETLTITRGHHVLRYTAR